MVAALGLAMKDLFPPRTTSREPKPRMIAMYPYHDEQGNVLFECVRYRPKDFKQHRPDPQQPGKWIWSIKGVRRVLYRLPELKAAIAAGQTIYIVAGEKGRGRDGAARLRCDLQSAWRKEGRQFVAAGDTPRHCVARPASW